MYDYLIVGAGMAGSVFAHEAHKRGKRVAIIDSRNHIGGNCYTEEIDGIHVHKYGPHIFHTNSDEIWLYINQFARFNHFVNRPKVSHGGNIYSFPINLMTLYQLWGVKTPAEARAKLDEVRIQCDNPRNMEEWALSQVGKEIYEKFVLGYTTKQWMRTPDKLPASILKRLPIRLTYDDNYFTDRYQGIPMGGYTQMFEMMLRGIERHLECDFFDDREIWHRISRKIVYTGPIDKLWMNCFGPLEYRTLRFDEERLDGDFQGNAVVNYTESSVPFTRIAEHKHFDMLASPKTVITREYPAEWTGKEIPYYPVNDEENDARYRKYRGLAEQNDKYIVTGRLGRFQYFDMSPVIAMALKVVKNEFEEKEQ